MKQASAFRFAVIGMVVVTLAAAAFVGGFGAAYLLTREGFLPPPEPIAVETPLATEEPSQATLVPTPAAMTEDEDTFQVFWEAWDLVQRNYYGELPDLQTVAHGAIEGMIETLHDEYTYFVGPEIAALEAEDASGEFQGIGAWVGMDENGKLELIRIFEDSPAQEAGLLDGDRVLAVDGVSIVDATVVEAITLIRGPEGTDILLLVERQGVAETFSVTVTRARIDIPVTEAEILDGNVGYLRLYDFRTIVGSERLEEHITDLLAEDVVGIVFDLRGNPGGMVPQAVDVTDLFLRDGVVFIERWSDGTERTYEAHSGDVGEDVPLVVLVDRNSASAAEIVAGALQDHERAVLVGETTFGKGVAQVVFTLSDGSRITITAAQWFTPEEQAIHERGLIPDIEIPWPEEVEPDQDPQLDRATEYLLTGE